MMSDILTFCSTGSVWRQVHRTSRIKVDRVFPSAILPVNEASDVSRFLDFDMVVRLESVLSTTDRYTHQ